MISVSLDLNEKDSLRARSFIEAIKADDRFVFEGYSPLPLDVLFWQDTRSIFVEFKTVDDYITSIKSGHLFNQISVMRDKKVPVKVVVLGGDGEIYARATALAIGRGLKSDNYTLIIQDFEANCRALGVDIWQFERLPYKRILSHISKMFSGGNLGDHIPKAGNDRKLAALSMLVYGIGKKRSAQILQGRSIADVVFVLNSIDDDAKAAKVFGVTRNVVEKVRTGLWKR